MRTPVLLLIWRRPHTLRMVIDAMRPIAPKQLFVACDGPNPQRPGEVERVSATRALVEREIDWPCQIERLYADTNQGCRLGVSRAITWFFEQVEEGIILEDDCVPHSDFFPYCTTLLERYRHDTRVWCISGSNFQNGQWRGDGSYYFSHYSHCWGWASWRRCWRHYDAELTQLSPLLHSGLLRTIFVDPLEQRYWSRLWQQLHTEGKPDSWAYRWAFTCFANGGLTTLPNHNLVTNVGFGEGATHTTDGTAGAVINQTRAGLGNIKSPSFVLRDSDADHYSFYHIFGGNRLKFTWSLLHFRRHAASIRQWLRQGFDPN
jgi:hypothetical protein